jgi:hypothetical protein
MPDALYQVVNLDDDSACAWVRRWPLSRHRLPTFRVPHGELTRIEPEALH